MNQRKRNNRNLEPIARIAQLCIALSCMVLIGNFVFVDQPCFAQDNPSVDNPSVDNPSVAGQSVATESLISVGWDGNYRVGQWTGIQIDGNALQSLSQSLDGSTLETSNPDNLLQTVKVETRDGDAVRIRFGGRDHLSEETQASRTDNSGAKRWIYVIPGAEAAPLDIVVGDQTAVRQRFPVEGSPTKGPSGISRDMPWVMVFGDPLGIDQIGSNRILGRDSTVAVSIPKSSDRLPDSRLGYDAVDLMILNSAGIPALTGLNQPQQDAIVDWVHAGGRFVMMLGADAKDIAETCPWIHRLLPFEVTQTVVINPSDVETFTSSQTPLQEFIGAEMPRSPGTQRLMGRTTSRVSVPIAMEYRVGFGSVVAIAADLHSDPFVDWPERMEMITALIGPKMLPVAESDQVQSRLTAYDDLAGQFRASLDQFRMKKSLGFSVIALILLALVALIGPVDYLLVNRWIGKPLLGWLSFPLFAISLSAVLAWQASQVDSVKPRMALGSDSAGSLSDDSSPVTSSAERPSSATTTVETKQIELNDIDLISGFGRGHSFHYAYTHDAEILDVGFQVSQPFSLIARDATHRAAPFGFPGKSFGGIQLALEDARVPAYDTRIIRSKQDDANARRIISGLPLAPRSSKGILHTFDYSTDILNRQAGLLNQQAGKANGQIGVAKSPGSEYLKGEFANPLPVDILDGFVAFGNWTYLLPTRLPAGESVRDIDSLRQKNFRFFLSRRKAVDNSSEGEAWSPMPTDDYERLSQVLMFHRASGGSQYTRLRNQFLDPLDLSDVLVGDRCILMGRLKTPLTTLDLSSANDENGDPAIESSTETLSLIRVVLPVIAVKSR